MDRTAMRMKMRELLPGVPGDGLDYVLTEALKAGGVEAEAQALREEVERSEQHRNDQADLIVSLRTEVAALRDKLKLADADVYDIGVRYDALRDENEALRARVVVVPDAVAYIETPMRMSHDGWEEGPVRLHLADDASWLEKSISCPLVSLTELARLNGKTVSEGLLRGVLEYADMLLYELKSLLDYSGYTGDERKHEDADYLELRALLGEGKEHE